MAERIKSGIPGLDEAIGGGLIKNSINLISGGPGAGKSIFSLSFIYFGALKYKEKGMYITFDESVEDLKNDALEFKWDFEPLEKQGLVRFVYIHPYEVELNKKIQEEIVAFSPRRVVLDSISTLSMAFEDAYEVRKELYKLAFFLKRMNITAILTSEFQSEKDSFSRYGVEEYVADSVFVLHYGGFGGETDRTIRIIKMRRSSHIDGPIPIEINRKGLHVLTSDIEKFRV